MNFLFIHRNLVMGGTETLIARMSSWLITQGHGVILLLRGFLQAPELLRPEVKVIHLGIPLEQTDWRGDRFFRRLCQRLLPDVPIDCALVFSPDMLWFALGLKRGLAYPMAVIAGAWTPHAYGGRGLRGWLRDPNVYAFQRCLSARSRIFMSAEVQRSVGRLSGRNLDGWIWPLPVDTKRFACVARKPKKGLIVSIGRLDDMKTYNFYMIDVVKELVESGEVVSWHVYGDGPFKIEMMRKIEHYGLNSTIVLKGPVRYADMHVPLAEAHLFVGMGTALIEAGACGVPSIMAIPYHPRPTSYGYLHDLPGYSCGDVLDLPEVPIPSLAIRILHMDDIACAEEGEKNRRHAQRFDIDSLMHALVHRIESKQFDFPSSRPMALSVCGTALKAVWLSGFVRTLRRACKE